MRSLCHLLPLHVGVLPAVPLFVEEGRTFLVEDPEVIQHLSEEEVPVKMFNYVLIIVERLLISSVL